MRVGDTPLTIEQVNAVARGEEQVALSDTARARVRLGRSQLEKLIGGGTRIYGVNTGVGGNIGIELEPEQAELLQLNLMRHLSCATGTPLPAAMVRAAMLLRIVTFATGCSAVRLELVEALGALLNQRITPVVPRYGIRQRRQTSWRPTKRCCCSPPGMWHVSARRRCGGG